MRMIWLCAWFALNPVVGIWLGRMIAAGRAADRCDCASP